MKRSILAILTFVAATAVAAGCTLKKTDVPPLAGPSELSLSLSLSAQPDVLTQDGVSQSRVSIQAREANGQPASGVGMRAEIFFGGAVFDYGRLSTKNLVTDNSGHATLTYTAPALAGEPVDQHTVVTILITPAAADNRTSTSRQIDIRLVPPGEVLPPNGSPVPKFAFSPTNPQTLSPVQFDASASTDDGTIVSYAWNFGDGTTGTGVLTQHVYTGTGQFLVTLTVTDDREHSASTAPVPVSISQSTGPSAAFTFSPVNPRPGDKVFFNASASTAASGRDIVSYKWNFGTSTGTSASGVTVSKAFGDPGAYVVTLVVTDDAAQSGTTSQTVAVIQSTAPTAVFTFSPANPRPGTAVFFNGAASTAAAGRSIVNYAWNFGTSTGTSGSGVTVSKTFDQAGTFVVTLVVTDDAGERGTISQPVTVSSSTTLLTADVTSPTSLP